MGGRSREEAKQRGEYLRNVIAPQLSGSTSARQLRLQASSAQQQCIAVLLSACAKTLALVADTHSSKHCKNTVVAFSRLPRKRACVHVVARQHVRERARARVCVCVCL